MAKNSPIFKDQKTFKEAISQRVFADIVRDPGQIKGKRGKKTLSGEFFEASQELALSVMGAAEKKFAEVVKKEYIDSLDALTQFFDDGFDISSPPHSWKSFSPQYASRKRTADKRRGRGRKTADKFWVKERGGVNSKSPSLTAEFRRFTKSYKQSIRNTKGVVTFHSHKFVYKQNRFRISLDLIMPRPKIGGDYLTKLLHDSFFKRIAYTEASRTKASNSLDGGLKKLAWLETGPPTYVAKGGKAVTVPARPFVSRHMVAKGKVLRIDLDNYLKALQSQAVGKSLVGFNK